MALTLCINIASGVVVSIYIGLQAQEARCLRRRKEGIYHVAMRSWNFFGRFFSVPAFILKQMSSLAFDEPTLDFVSIFDHIEALSRCLNRAFCHSHAIRKIRSWEA